MRVRVREAAQFCFAAAPKMTPLRKHRRGRRGGRGRRRPHADNGPVFRLPIPPPPPPPQPEMARLTCRRCGGQANQDCGGCGLVRYCSNTCEWLDTPAHTHVCKKLSRAGTAGAIHTDPRLRALYAPEQQQLEDIVVKAVYDAEQVGALTRGLPGTQRPVFRVTVPRLLHEEPTMPLFGILTAAALEHTGYRCVRLADGDVGIVLP